MKERGENVKINDIILMTCFFQYIYYDILASEKKLRHYCW